jgi:hypothetical protein
MTDNTVDAASLLADFYELYRIVSLEHMEYAGMLLTLLIAYSSDSNIDNTLKIRQK